MFDSKNQVVGVEIGTAKVVAMIGEWSPSGALNVIGVGQAKSRGVRKGEVINGALVSEDLREAIVDAEEQADAEVRSIFLSVSGGHVRSLNNLGFHPVASHDRAVTQEDLADALKNARAVAIPPDSRLIHIVRQNFLVDGRDGVKNPVGLTASKVEVDVHVIHANSNKVQDFCRSAENLQLEVEALVFGGVASALAVTGEQQRELGCVVLDIGAGTSDYVVYHKGVIKASGVLAVGGDHVTSDLSHGLDISLPRAEKLKLDHGSVVEDEVSRGQLLDLSNEFDLTEKQVKASQLRRIAHLRMRELFELVAGRVDREIGLDDLIEGVILCGGAARIRGACELAAATFGRPCRLGVADAVGGVRSALEHLEFAGALGLLRFGQMELRKRREGKGTLTGGLRSKFAGLLGRR